MSRIGKKPITIPAGLKVTVEDGLVTVTKGNESLSQSVPTNFQFNIEGDTLTVVRPNDQKQNRALHGLYRSLIQNMVEGLDKGFSKNLEITGVGFRAAKQGKTLVMNLGFSHQVEVTEPERIRREIKEIINEMSEKYKD